MPTGFAMGERMPIERVDPRHPRRRPGPDTQVPGYDPGDGSGPVQGRPVLPPWNKGGSNSYLEEAAKSGQGGPVGATPFYGSPGVRAGSDPSGIMAGYERVQGQDIVNDPAIAAVIANFGRNVRPGIQNSAALAGLGNSSAMVDSLADAQANMLLPLYQDAFAREQHALDRGFQGTESFLNRRLGATEEELGRRERSSVRQAEALERTIPMLLSLGDRQTGRLQTGIGTAMEAGGVQRGIEDARNRSAYDDFIRRQGLGEQAVFGPLGQTIPSSFGSVSRQSGGMFK
jgi:hypothetical protein